MQLVRTGRGTKSITRHWKAEAEILHRNFGLSFLRPGLADLVKVAVAQLQHQRAHTSFPLSDGVIHLAFRRKSRSTVPYHDLTISRISLRYPNIGLHGLKLGLPTSHPNHLNFTSTSDCANTITDVARPCLAESQTRRATARPIADGARARALRPRPSPPTPHETPTATTTVLSGQLPGRTLTLLRAIDPKHRLMRRHPPSGSAPAKARDQTNRGAAQRTTRIVMKQAVLDVTEE